jgi:HEAT repeat protein
MAKARSTEAKLARLRELRGQEPSPQQCDELRAFLNDASNFVVAEAATIIGANAYAGLTPHLVKAFGRLLDDGEKTDKLCRGKIAIIETLNKLEFADEEFFLRGIRVVQNEPVWGGSVDTAIAVRVASAFGLVRLRSRGVLALLVDMLAAEDKAERVGAVQALAYSGAEAAGLVLRLKSLLGDEESEVISECLGGLLDLNPVEGIPFVAKFLDAPTEAIQEAALLALGGSRRPEAFEVLKSFAERNQGEIQEVAFVALALLRLPTATDLLLTRVAEPASAASRAAVAALAIHRYDERIRERTAAAVTQNGDPVLRALFEKRFRSSE